MNPVETVQRLIALAANAGAAPEEARTAAVAAAKLVVQHGLRIVSEHDLMKLSQPEHVEQAGSRRRIRCKFENSKCWGCADPISLGDVVWWRKGEGVVCCGCHEEGL